MQEYEDTINLTRHDFENHLENTSNTIDKILNSIQTFILEKYGLLFIASSIIVNIVCPVLRCWWDVSWCWLPCSVPSSAAASVLPPPVVPALCSERWNLLSSYLSMNRRCEPLHKTSRPVVVPANVVLEAGRGEQPRTITSITSTRNRCEHQLRSKLLSIYLCIFRNLLSSLLLAAKQSCSVLKLFLLVSCTDSDDMMT